MWKDNDVLLEYISYKNVILHLLRNKKNKNAEK